METGEVIKFLRKNFNMTQDELAIKLRVNKSSVQKYESGAVQNLKLETIRELCELFNIPPWILIFPNYIQSEETILNAIKYNQIRMLSVLNNVGISKIVEYVQDLSGIDKYKISQDKSR